MIGRERERCEDLGQSDELHRARSSPTFVGARNARHEGMSTNDIQGNSWTDEPEIPNTKREGNQPAQKPERQQDPQQERKEPSSQQRPPSDS